MILKQNISSKLPKTISQKKKKNFQNFTQSKLRAKKKSGREGKRIRSEIVKFKIKLCGIPRLNKKLIKLKKKKKKN